MQAKMRKNIDKSKKCVIVKHKSKKLQSGGNMSFTQLKEAFKHLERGEYWHLRYWSELGRQFKINSWSDWNKLLSNASWGDTGLLNFLCFCLIMYKARTTPDLIDEEKRNNYQSWNEFFQQEFLKNFPAVCHYQRMYEAAGNFNINFRRYGQNHSPVADILNYSGYIYRKLLDSNIDLNALAQSCDLPVNELEEIRDKINKLRLIANLTPEHIAEDLSVSLGAAQQIYRKMEHRSDIPRICRNKGELVYFFPKETDFGRVENRKIVYLFQIKNEVDERCCRYRKEHEHRWQLYDGSSNIPLSNCSKITVLGKEEELHYVYFFENSGTYPATRLRTNTSYSCLKSGTFPENASVVVEDSEGCRLEFKEGQNFSGGDKVLLVENDRIITEWDIFSGNEIDFFEFASEPVDWVSKKDYPCFSTFPALEIGVDNAEYYLNGEKVDDFEIAAQDKYGKISLEVKTQNYRRKKTCRLLPRDFKVSVRVDGETFDYTSGCLEFSKPATIVFESKHLKEKKVEFRLKAMATLIEVNLPLDNGDEIPVKFNIPRSPGAYISLAKTANSETSDIPLENRRDIFLDWDEFKEFGELHISRSPEQSVGIQLCKGQDKTIGASYIRGLKLSYSDLRDIVFNEAMLLSVTCLNIIFFPIQRGGQKTVVSIRCRASSLARVNTEKQEDNLLLKFPYAKRLWQDKFFLVLKKVEDQAADPIVVLPENQEIPNLPEYCCVSSVRCKILTEAENISEVSLLIPGFYQEGQQDFRSKAYLGFIMKPKYSGFIRCNQGFFIKTEWKPENEEKYLENLMCGKEFLDIYGEGSASVLEKKFKSDDEKVKLFIDEFLKFSKLSQAQPFMDVCFHREETFYNKNKRAWESSYTPSGYIFLAENYWLQKLTRQEYMEELYLYWDPELFSLEAMGVVDFPDINEEYQKNWPSLYLVQCVKQNRPYGNEISKEDFEEEIKFVNDKKLFSDSPFSDSPTETIMNCIRLLVLWRKNRSVKFPDVKQFYEFRLILQTLRQHYPLCYRYIAEQAYNYAPPRY